MIVLATVSETTEEIEDPGQWLRGYLYVAGIMYNMDHVIVTVLKQLLITHIDSWEVIVWNSVHDSVIE